MKQVTYAAYNVDEQQRKISSSGGIFILLAKKVLKNKGVVYGVAMDSSCKEVYFSRIDTMKNIKKIMSSKYLQAKVGDSFILVKRDLEEGLPVLFTGTGCQINGLKIYLSKEYDNLYCVDVVCHGVPSPKLWRKYVDWIEEKYNSNLVEVNFRCKDSKWGDFGIKQIREVDKQIYISRKSDMYMQMFLKNLSLRPSCYNCIAKQIKLSDMSIADFWGIDSIKPELNDNKGISMVIVRTKKGEKLFQTIKNNIISEEIDYEVAIKENSAEYKSANKPIEREKFFIDMNQLDFKLLAKKYIHISFKRRIKNFLMKSFNILEGQKNNKKDYTNYGVWFKIKE